MKRCGRQAPCAHGASWTNYVLSREPLRPTLASRMWHCCGQTYTELPGKSETIASVTRSRPHMDVLRAALRQTRLQAPEPVLLRDGANTLYRLADDTVARIGKPGAAWEAGREVAIAGWLLDQGVNAVRPQPASSSPRSSAIAPSRGGNSSPTTGPPRPPNSGPCCTGCTGFPRRRTRACRR